MSINNDTNIDRQRLIDREMDELIGICRGILFDGDINDLEAQRLHQWLDDHPLVANLWPATVVREPLGKVIASGADDPDAEGELLRVVAELIGDPMPIGKALHAATSLPLDMPQPRIEFNGRVFCLTGNFALGPRKEVEAAILARGGDIKKDPSRQTSYLVVGEVGSAAWMHSSFGRKIERSVQLRTEGVPLAIICEAHFSASL